MSNRLRASLRRDDLSDGDARCAAGECTFDLATPGARGICDTWDAELLGARLATKLAGRFSPPIAHADVFITEDCNHRCDYCFVKGKNGLRAMTQDVARASVDFLLQSSRNMTWIQVLFFGGEPLLEFELIEYITRYGKERGRQTGKDVRFSLTTNGTLMNEGMAGFLAEHGISYLLSIDGCKRTHDAHRHMLGGASSYDEVMSRLPMMKRYQPWIGTRITVHPDTVTSLRSDVEHLFDRGVNQFIIGPASGIDWPDDALNEYEAQMHMVTDLYKALKARNAPFRMTLYERDIEKVAGPAEGAWGCGAGRGRICISVDGGLYPCAKVLGVDALQDTHKLGDVWQGVTNLRARRDYLNTHPSVRPQCMRCKHADECTGGCPAVNWEATGSIFEPAPLECRFTEVFHRIRKRYHE